MPIVRIRDVSSAHLFPKEVRADIVGLKVVTCQPYSYSMVYQPTVESEDFIAAYKKLHEDNYAVPFDELFTAAEIENKQDALKWLQNQTRRIFLFRIGDCDLIHD
jgi:hypothetical protein